MLLNVQHPWGVLLVTRGLPEPFGRERPDREGQGDAVTLKPTAQSTLHVHSVTDGAGSHGGLIVIIIRRERPWPDADTYSLLVLPTENHPALPQKPHEQTTCLSIPKGYLSKTLREMMTGRPVVSTYHNFLKGLQLHNKYLENENFCMWKGNWKLL